MEAIVDIILESGRSAIELALYILLPIMVVMLSLMTFLEDKGVLNVIARVLSPVLRIFGLPGLGVFAALQLLLVGFAAPAATLAIMEHDRTARRKIAATLAMILTMSQANAVFPLVAVGLNLWAIMLSSLAGGLLASTVTYYLFARSIDKTQLEPSPSKARKPAEDDAQSFLAPLIKGGHEGLKIVVKAIPVLVLAILAMNIIRAAGIMSALESALAPALSTGGLPAVSVLPIASKYLAGGTAMTGITLDLFQEGALSPLELNRMAGFMINPLDVVGLTVLIAAGRRCASAVKPAVLGAMVGILARAVLHLVIFG